ncbi:neopullulanase [Lachnospiraceae bacterium KM106-2]|nr:neopullulanase [Lachnospiraceae bacterium KM106-2]
MERDVNFQQVSKRQMLQMYIENTTPILNRKALFADGTKFYRWPNEPACYDKVTLRFRTARDNVDMVYVVYGNDRKMMRIFHSDQLFDYYETEIQLTEERIFYYYEIYLGSTVSYYNQKGILSEPQHCYDFIIKPGFKTPDWAKGAVFYQIFVDRFFNGDTSNDVEDREYIYIGEPTVKVTDWNKYPANMGVREFYGGDLKGIMKKLDYIQSLGVDAIYLNPIFVSPSNHKYDIQDYDYVDPHYGSIVKDEGEVLEAWDYNNQNATKYISRVTDPANLEASNRAFIELVDEIHKRGMKIILDGVFNHCGSFNKWLDRERIYEKQEGYEKGAYIDENSPYRTFFKFRDGSWPYNSKYDGWWGHDTLPKLNYEESQKLYQYIMRIARKWVAPPFNVDGWRLDVAADLGQSNEYNHMFWKDFRRNVKEANPNAIILAEHYGDPSAWLEGDEWDTVMNYDAFMEPITWFLTGVEKHSDEFRGDLLGHADNFFNSMRHHMSKFNIQSLQVAMNELSNHDHSRFLTRTNHRVGRTNILGPEAAEQMVNKGIMRIAVLMQMTWPGAPTIYYGDEAGLCGWTDPDNRRSYPWGKEDQQLIQLHRELIRIHKGYDALKTGSILFLGGSNKYICYGRFDQKDKFIVAINSDIVERYVEINAWEIGVLDDERMVQLIMTTESGYHVEAVIHHTENGILKLKLPPVSSIIIKNIEKY